MPKQNLNLSKSYTSKQALGKSGEELAAILLKDKGYKIIARNYKTKLGEIDIVACDKDTIAFIEVKARRFDTFGLPSEAISRVKQRQISKVALLFLKEKSLLGKKARFDVVSVVYSKNLPKLDLIKNAFELDYSFT